MVKGSDSLVHNKKPGFFSNSGKLLAVKYRD
jgi:hypothetical protein